MGSCRMPVFTLAVVLLLAVTATAAELPMAVGRGHAHVLARLAADDPTAERHRSVVVTGAGGASAAGAGAGAVEDDKAYIVGRPLFKVPPSSPCRRAKSAC